MKKQIMQTALCAVLGLTNLYAESKGAETPSAPAWEMETRTKLEAMAKNLEQTLKPWPVPDRTFEVEKYGAVGDGKTVSTAAIQQAIDACSASGGGVVLFSKGEYVTGTIELKSNVMLEISKDSRILGSTALTDYPERVPKRKTVMDTHYDLKLSLIYAEGVTNVGLRGPGTIDFRGTKENFSGKQTVGKLPGRPFGIRIIDSSHIVVENITLKDSAAWLQNYLNCENLIFQNMTVDNHANWNNDGLDIDGCRRVIVRDCLINAEDDAMCIKGASLAPTEDVLIENSTFVSTCNAFKIGTDTQGDFRRFYCRNLKLGGIPESMRTSRGNQASTGITLATVDGGAVEDILISNVTIDQCRAPIFMRVGSRGRLMPGMPKAPIGAFRRVIIEEVSGKRNFRQGSLISGIEKSLIEDVVIRDVDLEMEGGGTPEMASAPVPEDEGGYPDAQRFSVKGLPAYGFWVRHARNIHFYNITVTPAKPDARPLFATGGNTGDLSLDTRPIPELLDSAAQDDVAKMRLKNPLIDEPGMSDPHMMVVDDVCYLFTGHDVGVGVNNWVMPDWRIYRSDDLLTWTHVGTISPADNYMGKGNTSCWAGDCVQRNGKYYWYFSDRKKSTGVMVSTKPEGPYVDALGGPLVDSFDPTIFVDDDGTPYIIYGEHDYKIARLKDSMIELDEEPKTIELDRKGVFPKVDKNSLHKHNGIYYLSCSGYYATSKNIYGPYAYKGLVGKGWGLNTYYAHGDFFEWKGNWYHVWCKYLDRKKDRIRDCFIAPVTYGSDHSMRDDLSMLEKTL